MHTKQGLSSEQSNIAVQGLLGRGGTWLFGFHLGGMNISGRIKQSLYPRTRLGDLKVISIIYAPPYLMTRRSQRCSRSHARIVSEGNPESTQDDKHWKAINEQSL